MKGNHPAADDDHGGAAETKTKRGPGRPKASAGPKATAKSKAKPVPKVKAIAKSSPSKGRGAKKASEASAPAPEDSQAPLETEGEAGCLEAGPEDPRRAVKTRRGAFKKRGCRMGRKGKKASKVKRNADADDGSADSAEHEERSMGSSSKRGRSPDAVDDEPLESGPVAKKAKGSPKAKAKSSPKPKAKAKSSPKAKAKSSPKPKAKAKSSPKAKAKSGPKAKAKSSARAPADQAVSDDTAWGLGGFKYPKTFAGRWCPNVEHSYGWYVWRHIARTFIEIVVPNILDRTRSKKEVRCLKVKLKIVARFSFWSGQDRSPKSSVSVWKLKLSIFMSILAQLEYFSFAKKNFVASGLDVARPDVEEFFVEQAYVYIRDFMHFEAQGTTNENSSPFVSETLEGCRGMVKGF